MLAECGGGREAGIAEVCCAWEIGLITELKRWLVYEMVRCEVVGKCSRDRSVRWFAGEFCNSSGERRSELAQQTAEIVDQELENRAAGCQVTSCVPFAVCKL